MSRAFGLCVTVTDADARLATCEIVGEDEADARCNRIVPNSPLARALLGARVGEVVPWTRPAGTVHLEVVRIAHAHP